MVYFLMTPLRRRRLKLQYTHFPSSLLLKIPWSEREERKGEVDIEKEGDRRESGKERTRGKKREMDIQYGGCVILMAREFT